MLCFLCSLIGDFVAPSQMKYFIPLESITAKTYYDAKDACNRNWARLRNVWDETLKMNDLKAHFGVVHSSSKEMYSIERLLGNIANGLVVCESKLLESNTIMASSLHVL